MKPKPLIETDYFSKPWTWVKRIFAIVILAMIIAVWELEIQFQFLKLISFVLITLLILGKRKDDLMVDDQYLVHLKTSIFPVFSKEIRYEISRIKSIKGGGFHSQSVEILEFLSPGYTKGDESDIEIIFKDNSSTSLSVAIYKKDLKKVLETVREVMAKQNQGFN
ncbi:hypothetical protein QQ008_22245 [Fulvivirgaceae bacterium BMA10]|uniref:DUF5673 domain-containing protein n=1 Tax=Splendidivirga corallicola TaxID=3051826 RepID=A0ABT8KTN9_9BACT|nr:hypothetical protein [Fulvivirgaceae bacterium BMA10]